MGNNNNLPVNRIIHADTKVSVIRHIQPLTHPHADM
jgi:hypothetical protein